MLPPPTSNSRPFDTARPRTAPLKPSRASTTPPMIVMRIPSSRCTRRAKSNPLLASRIAAVATATMPRVDVVDEAQRRARTREQPQVARPVPLKHHHAAGIRTDVDDGHGIAASVGWSGHTPDYINPLRPNDRARRLLKKALSRS